MRKHTNNKGYIAQRAGRLTAVCLWRSNIDQSKIFLVSLYLVFGCTPVKVYASEVANSTAQNTAPLHHSVISIFKNRDSKWNSQVSHVRDAYGETVYYFSLASSTPIPNTIILAAGKYNIELACMSSSFGLKLVNEEVEVKRDGHYHVFCDGVNELPYLVSQKQ